MAFDTDDKRKPALNERDNFGVSRQKDKKF